MRLAILCSDDAHHGYLVRQLGGRFTIGAVVVEPGSSQRRRIRARGRWRDWFWATYHVVRRDVCGLNRYRRQYFGGSGPSRVAGAEWLCVDSINDPEVAALLTMVRPDLTVIMGTTILKRAVLDAAQTVINIHGGFLPYYRGNHCFFFALYEAAFDRIGSSIHFVDVGIDTGDLIERVVPPLCRNDNAERLYSRAEKLAIHRLVELLEALEGGTPLPRYPQTEKGRLFRTRDRRLRHDVWLWLRLRTGITRIPNRAAPVDRAVGDRLVTGSETR